MKKRALAMAVAAILLTGAAVTWAILGLQGANGGLDVEQVQATAAILAAGTIDAAIRAFTYLLNPAPRTGRSLPALSVTAIVVIAAICMFLPAYLIWLQARNVMQIAFGQFALVLGATQPVLILFLRRITSILFGEEDAAGG